MMILRTTDLKGLALCSLQGSHSAVLLHPKVIMPHKPVNGPHGLLSQAYKAGMNPSPYPPNPIL